MAKKRPAEEGDTQGPGGGEEEAEEKGAAGGAGGSGAGGSARRGPKHSRSGADFAKRARREQARADDATSTGLGSRERMDSRTCGKGKGKGKGKVASARVGGRRAGPVFLPSLRSTPLSLSHTHTHHIHTHLIRQVIQAGVRPDFQDVEDGVHGRTLRAETGQRDRKLGERFLRRHPGGCASRSTRTHATRHTPRPHAGQGLVCVGGASQVTACVFSGWGEGRGAW